MKARIPVEWIPTKEARSEEMERRQIVRKQSIVQIAIEDQRKIEEEEQDNL